MVAEESGSSMNGILTSHRQIGHRHSFHVDSGREPVQVRCVSGAVWVTMEGIHDDFVMGAGDAVDFCPPGRIVVYALADSEVKVCQ